MILMSVQETLLPQQVSRTNGYIYFPSQSTTQRKQEGCSEPGRHGYLKRKKKKDKRKKILTTSPLVLTYIHNYFLQICAQTSASMH